MLRLCVRLCSLLVALLAIFVGLLTSGILSKHTPFFVMLDQLKLTKGTQFLGLVPAMHRDVPWGFTYEELAKIDLSGQNILITGGNVGLGYWSAYHIAKTNANVIIACRDMAKCQSAVDNLKKETGKSAISAMELDLSSFESIRKFSKEFRSKYQVLDSLMLNAGVMTPPFSKTKDGLELQIGVNHFGHFLLTQELLPLLEAAADKHKVATICVVSSAAHYDSYSEGILGSIEEMNDEKRYVRAFAYGQSKLANVLFAQELAERLRSKNILVNSIHPGAVATELGRYQQDAAKTFIGESASNYIFDLISSGMWQPKEAALTQVYASISPSLKKNKVTGKYLHPIAREAIPHPHTRNLQLQKNLWKMSEEFISSH